MLIRAPVLFTNIRAVSAFRSPYLVQSTEL